MDRVISNLLQSRDLSLSASETLFRDLGRGRISTQAGVRILLLLGRKGIGVHELLGAVHAFKKLAVQFRRPKYRVDPMDNCGTGGDGKNTFNISTAASFVIAGSGIPVAKHGNRGVSSGCGSADLLQALGIDIEAPTGQMLDALAQAKMGYFHAPLYHRAMRRVLPIREELKIKTIFNVLGPLLNPLDVKYQLIGTFDSALLYPMADVLSHLGRRRAVLVHGRDGLDEVSVSDKTDVVVLDRGRITSCVITPEALGIRRVPVKALHGGTAAERAEDLRALFSGRGRPALRDAVTVNAAFGIWAYDRSLTLDACLMRARNAIVSGRAGAVVKKLQLMTR